MATLSKLSAMCSKCPHVKNCNNKRVEACVVLEWDNVNQEISQKIKPPLVQNATNAITPSVMQPVLRDTSLNAQIAEKIKQNFYANIFNFNCR